jgi:hypothetical protein
MCRTKVIETIPKEGIFRDILATNITTISFLTEKKYLRLTVFRKINCHENYVCET